MSLPTQYDRTASSADVNPKSSETEQPCDPASTYATLTNADLGIISADKVEMTPIRWLWPYRFATGEIAHAVADGDCTDPFRSWVLNRFWPWRSVMRTQHLNNPGVEI